MSRGATRHEARCPSFRRCGHPRGLIGTPLSDDDWRMASLGVASGGLGARSANKARTHPQRKSPVSLLAATSAPSFGPLSTLSISTKVATLPRQRFPSRHPFLQELVSMPNLTLRRRNRCRARSSPRRCPALSTNPFSPAPAAPILRLAGPLALARG